MPKTRGSIPPPSARDSQIKLRARLFSSHYSGALTRPVSAIIPFPVSETSSSASSVHRIDDYPDQVMTRYPCVEPFFENRDIQPFVHDTRITMIERGRSHSFILFCQNHVRLPLNQTLGSKWKGDILVMRLGKGRLAGEVVNLQTGDNRRTQKVVSRFLKKMKQGRPFRLPPQISL